MRMGRVHQLPSRGGAGSPLPRCWSLPGQGEGGERGCTCPPCSSKFRLHLQTVNKCFKNKQKKEFLVLQMLKGWFPRTGQNRQGSGAESTSILASPLPAPLEAPAPEDGLPTQMKHAFSAHFIWQTRSPQQAGGGQLLPAVRAGESSGRRRCPGRHGSVETTEVLFAVTMLTLYAANTLTSQPAICSRERGPNTQSPEERKPKKKKREKKNKIKSRWCLGRETEALRTECLWVERSKRMHTTSSNNSGKSTRQTGSLPHQLSSVSQFYIQNIYYGDLENNGIILKGVLNTSC